MLTDKAPTQYTHSGKIEEVARLEAQAQAMAEVIQREFKLISFKQGMKVLDAGCGTGANTRKIANTVSPGEVIGIDMDSLFITEARKFASNEGIRNVHYDVGDITHLQYPDKIFDVTYCRLVLMHVNNPITTVTELKRVTKPKGLIAVSDNDDGGVITFPEMPKMIELWTQYGQSAKERGEDRYIGRQLFSILSQAGLHSVSIHPLPIHATQQNPEMLKLLVSVPVQIIELSKEDMLNGYMTESQYQEALQEVHRFLNHPGAFAMGINFLAIGEVPNISV
jgi:ubiquinone/menaquinone biosynthesis C-methylase UbiE